MAHLYCDETLTISATEIRWKLGTVYLRNVTGVSIATHRPGKFAPFLGLFSLPVFTFGWFSPFGSFLGPSLWLIFVPEALVLTAIFLIRSTQLNLQTTGGPVILASHVSFSEPLEALERYDRM